MKTRRSLFAALVAILVALGAAWWFARPHARASLAGGQRSVRPEPAASSALLGPGSSSVPPDELRAMSAREGVLPAGTAADDGPQPEGALRGFVIDHRDEPVPGVEVALYRGRKERVLTTDDAGAYAFEELPRGRYRLFVEPRSLSSDLLPPWHQHESRAYEGTPSGRFGTVVQLTEGLQTDVNLRVLGKASARGQVVDAAGEPFADAIVHFVSLDGVEDAVRSGPDGGFEAERLYPGRYTASVEVRSEGRPVGGGSALPVRFDLAAGEYRQLPDLVLGAGGHRITGTVVDEAGEPVEGLLVECRELAESEWRSFWRARTDAAGRYELGRVRTAEVVVTLGPDEGAKDVERTLLAGPVEPFPVDLRAAREVFDLGVTAVERNRPFRVVGRVEVDPVWARERNLDPRGVQIRPRTGGGPPMRVLSGGTLGEGKFAWACEAPSEPVTLQIVLGTSPDTLELKEIVVTPRAGVTQEVVVEFP